MFPQGEIMKLFVEIGFGVPYYCYPLERLASLWGTPGREEAPCREPPLPRAQRPLEGTIGPKPGSRRLGLRWAAPCGTAIPCIYSYRPRSKGLAEGGQASRADIFFLFDP